MGPAGTTEVPRNLNARAPECEIFLNPGVSATLESGVSGAGGDLIGVQGMWRFETKLIARKNAQLYNVIRIALWDPHDQMIISKEHMTNVPTRYFPERSHSVNTAFDDRSGLLFGPLRTS